MVSVQRAPTLSKKPAFVLALCLWALSPVALAQSARTTIFQGVTPAQPVVGERFLIDVFQGLCESLDPDPLSATTTTLPDGTLRIFIPAVIDVNCNVATASRQYVAGAIATPGERRLEVYIQSLTPGEPPDQIGLQWLTVVSAESPLVAPAADVSALLVLGFASLLAGLARFRAEA